MDFGWPRVPGAEGEGGLRFLRHSIERRLALAKLVRRAGAARRKKRQLHASKRAETVGELREIIL
jgi:hypothetical protein